jgi:hypothetical protein
MYGLKPIPSKTEAVCVNVRAKARAFQRPVPSKPVLFEPVLFKKA